MPYDLEPNQWYPEPEWCSRRLFEVHPFKGEVLDPFAGRGSIPRAARAAGLRAYGCDLIHRPQYPEVAGGADFFDGPWSANVANIVTNPPYGFDGDGGRLEERAIRLALERSERQVAAFCDVRLVKRGAFLEALPVPLQRVLFISPRPSCPPGPDLESGKTKATGGRTDYAWYIWTHGHVGPPVISWLRRDG